MPIIHWQQKEKAIWYIKYQTPVTGVLLWRDFTTDVSACERKDRKLWSYAHPKYQKPSNILLHFVMVPYFHSWKVLYEFLICWWSSPPLLTTVTWWHIPFIKSLRFLLCPSLAAELEMVTSHSLEWYLPWRVPRYHYFPKDAIVPIVSLPCTAYQISLFPPCITLRASISYNLGINPLIAESWHLEWGVTDRYWISRATNSP